MTSRVLITGGADTVAARTVSAFDKGRYLVLPQAEAVLGYAANSWCRRSTTPS